MSIKYPQQPVLENEVIYAPGISILCFMYCKTFECPSGEQGIVGKALVVIRRSIPILADRVILSSAYAEKK